MFSTDMQSVIHKEFIRDLAINQKGCLNFCAKKGFLSLSDSVWFLN